MVDGSLSWAKVGNKMLFSRKRVTALSYDDCPSAANSPKIARFDAVGAVWFVMGTAASGCST